MCKIYICINGIRNYKKDKPLTEDESRKSICLNELVEKSGLFKQYKSKHYMLFSKSGFTLNKCI